MVNNPTPRLRKLGLADKIVSNLPFLCIERHYCVTCLGSLGIACKINQQIKVLGLILDLYDLSPILS